MGSSPFSKTTHFLHSRTDPLKTAQVPPESNCSLSSLKDLILGPGPFPRANPLASLEHHLAILVAGPPGFGEVQCAGSVPFFFFINLFIFYLFLAVLGLRCCARAFSSCDERGLLFIVMHGLLIAVASLVVEHGL